MIVIFGGFDWPLSYLVYLDPMFGPDSPHFAACEWSWIGPHAATFGADWDLGRSLAFLLWEERLNSTVGALPLALNCLLTVVGAPVGACVWMDGERMDGWRSMF